MSVSGVRHLLPLILVAACTQAAPTVPPAPDSTGLAYVYPTTHAGCYALSFRRRDGAAATAPYPGQVRLDTEYVVVGVPEAVAFHKVMLPRAWKRRLPGRHYWGEIGDTVLIFYEGTPTAGELMFDLTARGDTLLSGPHGPWQVVGHRRDCQGMKVE
jgi:hypothetical protein